MRTRGARIPIAFPRTACTVACTVACVAALAAVAGAQSAKSPVGIHEIEPGLVHPTILPKLKERSRQLQGLDLALHPSVPMRVKLTAGKRPQEYLIEAEPKLGITRLIVPGLVNNKLTYGPKQIRPVRFEIWENRDSLWICNHHGAFVTLAGHEITFVDLDHDGALGAITDGYVVKPPKEKYWADPQGRVKFRAISEPLLVDGKPYWMQVDDGGFTMIVSDRMPDFSAKRDASYEQALTLLNSLRRRLGHAPVTVRTELSRACEEHALYCATNDTLVHEQDPKKAGASPEGQKAGMAAELAKAATMADALRQWNGTFFHRLAMLSPQTQRVGMGLMHGVAVLDAKSDFKSLVFEPWSWPPDRAEDVPVAWTTGEDPSPIGEVEFTGAVAAGWGHPITLTFPTRAITGVEAKLTVAGTELPVFVSSPERPSNQLFPDNANSILVMARAPLPANAEVRVVVRGQYCGKPFEKAWSFRTRGR